MNYDLKLQIAINEMAHQIWETDALFVLSLQSDKEDIPMMPLFLDVSTLNQLDYTADGLLLILYAPDRSTFQVNIAYSRILK